MTVRFLECRGMAPGPLVRKEKRQRERKFLTVIRVSAFLPPNPKIRIFSACPSTRMCAREDHVSATGSRVATYLQGTTADKFI